MPEVLGSGEVGKQIAEHARLEREHDAARDRRALRLSIAEAVLLSVVSLLAALSGYAAAKWSTESSLDLAHASALRAEANEASLQAMTLRNFDSSTFDSWFSAYIAGNQQAMDIAAKRFRPEFKVAFDAWIAQDPTNNPNAAPGPTYVPEYKQPGLELATTLEGQAEVTLEAGVAAGENSDLYVRTTILLASVLFLMGISTHFPIHGGRYGLIGLGALLMIAALVQLASLPKPPL